MPRFTDGECKKCNVIKIWREFYQWLILPKQMS